MAKGYFTIEEKAKRKFGITEIPEFAGYILASGEMLNFSYEGRQRDVDHREIGEFFSGTNRGFNTFMDKFIRRGNIRCSCNSGAYGFEFVKIPTKEQWHMLQRLHKEANELGLSFYIERCVNGRIKSFHSFYAFADYISKKATYCIY